MVAPTVEDASHVLFPLGALIPSLRSFTEYGATGASADTSGAIVAGGCAADVAGGAVVVGSNSLIMSPTRVRSWSAWGSGCGVAGAAPGGMAAETVAAVVASPPCSLSPRLAVAGAGAPTLRRRERARVPSIVPIHHETKQNRQIPLGNILF